MKGKKVVVKIAADVDKKLRGQMKSLVGGLNATTTSMAKLEKEQRQLQKLQKMDVATKKLKDEYNAAAEHYGKLKKLKLRGTEEEKARQKQERVAAKARMDTLRRESADQIKAFEKYKQGLKKLKIPLDDYEKSLAGIGSQLKKLERTKKVQARLKKVGLGFKKLGRMAIQAAKVGAVAGAALVSSLAFDAGRGYLDFNKNMKRVQAISGATAEEFKLLEDSAIKLAGTSKFTSSETAQGMEYLALAGFKTNEILQAMPGLLDLAAASGEDLGNVSDIVSDNLTAFNLQASEAGRVADVLAKTSSSTNTNVAMLGEAFKYAAAPAAAMGGSIEEVSAMLGIMADNGIKASQAGTTLRSAYLRLAKPTKEMKESIESLGLSLEDKDGNFIGMSSVIQQLQNSFKGMTNIEQAKHLTSLFGKTAVSGMTSIINSVPGSVDRLTESLENADGAAKRMSLTMLEGPSGAIELLKSSYDSFKIIFGRALFTPQVVEGIKTMSLYLNGLVGALTGDYSTAEASFFASWIENGKQFLEMVKEIASRVWQFFKDIIPDNIGTYFETFNSSFRTGLELFKSLFKFLESLKPLFKFILGLAIGFITGTAKVFEKVVGWITKLIDLLTSGINKIKLPKWVKALASKYTEKDKSIDGSHKAGLANVPYDGYIAELHAGERVLTAEENKDYKGRLGTRVSNIKNSSSNSVVSRKNTEFSYHDNRVFHISGDDSSIEKLKALLEEERKRTMEAIMQMFREEREDKWRGSYE